MWMILWQIEEWILTRGDDSIHVGRTLLTDWWSRFSRVPAAESVPCTGASFHAIIQWTLRSFHHGDNCPGREAELSMTTFVGGSAAAFPSLTADSIYVTPTDNSPLLCAVINQTRGAACIHNTTTVWLAFRQQQTTAALMSVPLGVGGWVSYCLIAMNCYAVMDPWWSLTNGVISFKHL